jgi:ubiquinone/menaquinone biosynthesis C-methylase UbiE
MGDVSMSLFPLSYWDRAATANPYDAVRTGWTKQDFDTRTDDSLACSMEFRPGDVVLDYGCGPGYAARLIAPKVGRYIGVDYSEVMLNLARERNQQPNAEFVKGDGLTIPLPDASVNVVICELVLQHLTRATSLKLFDEMRRALKPDGRAAIQFPTRFYGADIGFAPEELARPGWRVSCDEHPRHYIYLRCPTRP